MSKKVNQDFVNFINQKKIKTINNISDEKIDPNADLDNVEHDARELRNSIAKKMKKLKKEKFINYSFLEKTDNNQNDGSLKDLLSRMTGTVIYKVIEAPQPDENESDDEESEESEDEREEEKINHYARTIEDIAIYNSESEDDDDEEELEEEVEEEEKPKERENKKSKDKRQVQCELFAENIPFDKDEKFIVKFFKNLSNKIVKIKVLKDKEDGRCKGKAFLKFFNVEDAEELHKKTIKIDKNQITLTLVKKFEDENGNDEASNKNKKNNKSENKFDKNQKFENIEKYSNKFEKPEKKRLEKTPINNNLHTAFIRNLPLLLEEKTINKLFKGFGKIINVRLMKNKEGKSKGFAYIDFDNEQSLAKAITSANNTPIVVEGKDIYIEKAKSSFNEIVFEDSKRLGKKKKRTEEKKMQLNQSIQAREKKVKY